MDLIERDKVMHEIDQLSHAWEYGNAVDDCYEIVKKAPAVDAIPIEWLENFRDGLDTLSESQLMRAIDLIIDAYRVEKKRTEE